MWYDARMSRFIRHDLMCTDVAAGVRFYADLFGWKTTEVAVMGFKMHRLSLGDRVLGGVMPFDASHGFPSHWVAYAHVGSVDDCCKRVKALGGKVGVPPTNIPPGRFAVASDPTGAIFSPFTPKEAPPADGDLAPVGGFCWDELLTSDPAAARAFYAELLGWTHVERDMGEHGAYTVFSSGGARAAGLLAMPPGGAERSSWLPYVRVAGADETVARALRMGAEKRVPPTDIPGIGRFAILQDPTGATIGVLQSQA